MELHELERINTSESFDTWLREVARISEPASAAPARQVCPGLTLMGGRFERMRLIGEGGMGHVFAAFDRERRTQVAVKMLSRADPHGVSLLKNEFRSLADIVHPNLGRLHELFSEDGRWFFTMDLVEGVHFDTFVRPGGCLDEQRLLRALVQLLAAVEFLHGTGRLHRDLKPNNVLITAEGRAVVLDFGLVLECGSDGVAALSPGSRLMGTPAYMAPEQYTTGPLSAATDVYAIGVMLFEALTGTLPFEGPVAQVLEAKRSTQPPSLGDLDAARELTALCLAMLSPDPAARPSISEILLRLGDRMPQGEPARIQASSAFIGRDAELGQLRQAYQTMLGGQATLVVVSGESGIGKSTLCRAMLRDIEAATVVLSARCHERESIPFKAFDPILDDLARQLARLSPELVSSLVGSHGACLFRVFPALRSAAHASVRSNDDSVDPLTLRQRAFEAFAALLGGLREQQPVVLYIDDLQWADVDSLALLRHLLVEQPAPRLLVLATCRHARSRTLPELARLLEHVRDVRSLHVRELELEPLARDVSCQIARDALVALGMEPEHWALRIAEEARGNPLVVVGMTQFARSAGHDALLPSFSDVLAFQCAALSSVAMGLLDTLALAGQPIPLGVALESADADDADIESLATAKLVRRGSWYGRTTVECYHDLIRDAVASHVSEERRKTCAGALARALRGFDGADPELLCWCLEVSGERAAAAHFAEVSARRAAEAMAFDLAATLYDKALTLGDPPAEHRLQLSTQHGAALAHAGRCADAAAAFLSAAALADPPQRLVLHRRAAEQLLAAGSGAQGSALLQQVCRQGGVELRGAGAAGVSRSKARRVGVSAQLCRQRHRVRPGPEALARLDMLDAILVAMIGHWGAESSAKLAADYLERALSEGGPAHVVRALATNVMVHNDLRSPRRWTERLRARLNELAYASGDSELVGIAELANGAVECHRGHFALARVPLEHGLAALRHQPGYAWERDLLQTYLQSCLFACGEYAELARTTPRWIEEAFQKGRLWAAVTLSGHFGTVAWLTADDSEGCQRMIDRARRAWQPSGAQPWLAYRLRWAETTLKLYRGQPEQALEPLQCLQPAPRAGAAARFQAVHLGRSAASALGQMARHDTQRAATLRILHECIAVLRQPHLSPLWMWQGWVLKSAAEFTLGQREQAIERLRSAADCLETGRLHMQAAAVRRRLGQLLPGDSAMLERGSAFMRAQGVRNLDAMTEVWCPGFANA